MKILRLLSNYLILLILLIPILNSTAEEEPVDIWNIDKSKNKEKSTTESQNSTDVEINISSEGSIYQNVTNSIVSEIKLDEDISANEVKLIGLYDPEENGLKINMWSNTDGDQLKNIFKNLDKMDLSKDASELLNISLLTNAYYPKKNISANEFFDLKSNWLQKNSDLELLEEYLISNQIVNQSPNLSKFLIDNFLSDSNLAKSCNFFSKIKNELNDHYLSKFNIYCLFNSGQIEKAKLLFDLKKELGFKDEYFENKMNFLFGFSNQINEDISEKSILDFHLAHRVNSNFSYEPNSDTPNLIWKYLSASNLLFKVNDIEVSDLDKISIIEKATHEKNYSETQLLEIYKKFQFNINQLLTIKESHKLLPSIQSRALIYQGILLTSDISQKIEFMKMLKKSLTDDGKSQAFDKELKKLLSKMDNTEIPPNFTDFYISNLKNNDQIKKNVKYNNKVFHQSKLVKYFEGNFQKKKFEKEVNDFLKRIKKNKKYFFSKKDVIFLESLKSDGIKISEKFNDLYEVSDTEMPTDIQVMINNEDIGGALLRLVEVIGRDRVEDIDDETMYFIINTFNQLDIDPIRNRLLLKILPLKV